MKVNSGTVFIEKRNAKYSELIDILKKKKAGELEKFVARIAKTSGVRSNVKSAKIEKTSNGAFIKYGSSLGGQYSSSDRGYLRNHMIVAQKKSHEYAQELIRNLYTEAGWDEQFIAQTLVDPDYSKYEAVEEVEQMLDLPEGSVMDKLTTYEKQLENELKPGFYLGDTFIIDPPYTGAVDPTGDRPQQKVIKTMGMTLYVTYYHDGTPDQVEYIRG